MIKIDLGKYDEYTNRLASLLKLKRVEMWQVLFIAGLIISPLLIAAGLLVGFGTRLGSGCTSRHGICGNARLSPRSMAATVTFMLFGIVTVYFGRHVLGLI